MYFLLLLLQLFYSTTLHGSRPIVSLFAYSEGASAFIIGLLVTSYAFIPMLTAIRVGRWLDKYGAKRIFGLGALLICIALFVPTLISTITGVFISQVLLGFSIICINVSLQKTIGSLPGSRDKHIATLSFMGSTGGLLGPLLTGYIFQHQGIQIVYFVLLLIVIFNGLLLLYLRNKQWPNISAKSKSKASKSWLMLKEVPLRNALIISGLSVFSKELFTAYFPVLATNKGLSAGLIGLLIASSAAASMAVRFFQFQIVLKFGRAMVLFVAILISGISYICIPFFAEPFVLFFLVVVLGAGLGLGQPISLVQALNTAPKARTGEVLGLRITINRGAQVIAPFAFGMLGSVLGVAPIFWVSGSLLFAGTYFTKTANTGMQVSHQKK